MKRKVVVTSALIGLTVAGTATAWALITGTVTIPNIAEGISTGTSGSCQTNAVNFVVPAPTWNPSTTAYEISSVAYTDVDPACVTLGTADLELNIVKGGITVGSASDSNMGASTGSMSLTPALGIDVIDGATFNYLVKG
jgi:hypothetical protein